MFTLQGLKDTLFIKIDGSSFLNLIELQIDTLKAENRFGSMGTYIDTRSAVLKFTKEKNIPLSSIDKNWLLNFQVQLRKKCKPSTVNIYLRCIRRVFNIAIGQGLISSDLYPFGGGAGRIKIGNLQPN